MNSAPRQNSSLWLALFFAVIVSAFAISNQSLWIDEGGTAYKAMQPTLQGWWDALMWERNSNRQLPLYLLYAWAWEKFFGSSELALRAANVLPLLVCVGLLKYLFSTNRRQFLFGILFLLINPFVWFHLNEARPYMLLLAASLGVFAAVAKPVLDPSLASDPPASWFRLLAFSSLAVTATSALAAVWVPFAIVAAWYFVGAKFWKLFGARAPLPLCVMIAGHPVCALYYIWTLKLGAAIPHFGQNLIVSIFHSGYELLGFTGLGPGRLDLRAAGPGSLANSIGPITALALLWLSLLYFAFRHSKADFPTRRTTVVLASVFLPVALVFAIGYQQHVRVSPRYLTPAFPLILIGQTLAADKLWRRTWGKTLIALFAGLLLISALEVRFAGRHAKEDYRQAAALTKNMIKQGAVVYWAADVQTAIYYGVIEEKERDAGSDRVVLHTQIDAARRLEQCDVVVLSRTDVYDAAGTCRQFIRDQQFRSARIYQGFVIYLNGKID
jgi:hypothetical protein